MQQADLGQITTMFVFTPAEGSTWRMTLESFASALQQRTPGEFTRVWDDPADGASAHVTMSFTYTLHEEELEGIASVRTEGVSLVNVTAQQAAEFVDWLRREVVPTGETVEFNTEAGMEWDFDDEIVPDGPPQTTLGVFLAHIARVVAADRGELG
ncbi:hypothetical protein [Streptomyces silvisoli]|uniref:Uncharacterized protein n=1 Tax=Streptomyces silvisoli TaxID=3034235 RepID=A0ABT5ZR13_9ACTN|nr:hypothetical protein [Streptomyces silvisoli]MDF3292265.1 hypothetical protein [Streptomyces silvisoli]